ncbi:MAG: DNA repair protein RecO [Thermomicrobiales bacterium]|nr:DNA repair protein RecO [Thermomicrobiales bacterium]
MTSSDFEEDSMISRDRNYSTEAIVIDRRAYGEADRILIVFTPNYGRLDVIAKGASKAKSRSGPYLDLCSWVNLELATGRDLEVVRSATPVRAFPSFHDDLQRFCHASYLVELVKVITHAEEPHKAVFELLSRSLVLLDEGVDAWMVTRHFEMALLNELGYRPQLFRCVGCDDEITAQVNAYSAMLGGLLCPACRDLDPQAIPLSVNAQKYLRLLQREGLTAVARLKPTLTERAEIQQALETYARFVADRDLRSLRALHELNLDVST